MGSIAARFISLTNHESGVSSPNITHPHYAWRRTLEFQETLICQPACHSGPQAPGNCPWQSVYEFIAKLPNTWYIIAVSVGVLC